MPPPFKGIMAQLSRNRQLGSPFPIFPDGDVRIIISNEMQYLLHSSVLKNSSPMMAELLDDQYISLKAVKQGLTVRHKLVLVNNPTQVNDIGNFIDYTFEHVLTNGRGRAVGGTPTEVDLDDFDDVPPLFLVRFHPFTRLACICADHETGI